MKTLIFVLAIVLNCSTLKSQIIEVTYPSNESILGNKSSSPLELFDKGYFDFFTNGSVQGTAQLLKINIGEKDLFYLPLYFLAGASGNGFNLDSGSSNNNTVSNLLNPIGGLFNITWMGNKDLYKSNSEKTVLKISTQLSAKFLNSSDTLDNENKFLTSGYGNLGLFFQTGAWEPSDPDNTGILWIQFKGTYSFFFSDKNLNSIFGNNLEDKFFVGYSLDAGLEIDKRINFKIGIYQYLNNQNIENTKDPVIKISLDYSLKK